MPLVIKYGEKLERKRIKNTLEKLSWYDKFGYSPRFPRKINPKLDNLEKIYAALKNEYKEEDYKKVTAKLNSEFSKIEDSFFKNLQKLCGGRRKRSFILILTKYGVGGSYSLPNKIIYNFGMKSSSVNTILHEIVHLVIEPYIQKYEIQQNEKERIVDLILSLKSFKLTNYKMQKRGEERKGSIDPIFTAYFRPPIDNFFKKLSNKKIR